MVADKLVDGLAEILREAGFLPSSDWCICGEALESAGPGFWRCSACNLVFRRGSGQVWEGVCRECGPSLFALGKLFGRQQQLECLRLSLREGKWWSCLAMRRVGLQGFLGGRPSLPRWGTVSIVTRFLAGRDGLSVAEIAHGTHLSVGQVSGLLARQERRKMVTRERVELLLGGQTSIFELSQKGEQLAAYFAKAEATEALVRKEGNSNGA